MIATKWPSLTVGKAQLLAVCELLGITPDRCASISMTARHVDVELYVVSENGAIAYDAIAKEPRTHTVTMNVI